jgi:protein tyrosine/serine phosphatase
MKKQIELLKKYNVTNYKIEDNKIIINGSLNLSSLTSVDKDFLKNTTINGSLNLYSLTSVDKDFLKNTTINGSLDLHSLASVDKDFLKNTTINGNLYLNSLTSVDKDFLKNTTINGSLYLYSLKSVDKDFLKNTTINGYLYLNSLTSVDKDFLKNTTINGSLNLYSLTSVDKEMLEKNVKKLQEGYNEEKGYCFFDGILSKVLSVKKTRGYTIYTTPFGFITQKKNKTAHGETIKKAIQDLEFKFIAETLKKTPIKANTFITEQYYRIITGACEQGVREWKMRNNIEEDKIKAKDLLPILEKTNAYGLDKFKELVSF